jgi:lauroyl/myristoyl acyltransferase
MAISRATAPLAQHAPELGATHRVLGRFHVTGVFWYRFAHWAFRTVPFWFDYWIVWLFSIGFFVALKRIRPALASNLEPVLGPTGRIGRLHRSWKTILVFAWCFCERYRLLAFPDQFTSVIDGEENWRQINESAVGAVIVTAHIGPWENATQFGAATMSRRIHVVREKEIDPRAQEHVEEILSKMRGNYVTHFSGDDPRLSFVLADALRDGDLVALQGDRPRAGGRSVTTKIFGRPMPLPIGPAALARSAGVPIVPIFNFREGRFRMRAVVRPPFTVAQTSDRAADIAAAVNHLAGEIEWAIKQHPHQWFCFRDLWGHA